LSKRSKERKEKREARKNRNPYINSKGHLKPALVYTVHFYYNPIERRIEKSWKAQPGFEPGMLDQMSTMLLEHSTLLGSEALRLKYLKERSQGKAEVTISDSLRESASETPPNGAANDEGLPSSEGRLGQEVALPITQEVPDDGSKEKD